MSKRIIITVIIVFSIISPFTHLSAAKDFNIIIKSFSNNKNGLTVGLMNINNKCSGTAASIEENKKRLLSAIKIFKKHKVNIAVFPEFALTGYFWPDPEWKNKGYDPKGNVECWEYMNEGCLNNNKAFLKVLSRQLDSNLQYIIVNGLLKNSKNSKSPASPENKFYNTNLIINQKFDCDNLCSNQYYNKIFIPGIENIYETAGSSNNKKTFSTTWGTFGLLTCFDLCFPHSHSQYIYDKNLDGVFILASWRGSTERKYDLTDVIQKHYYGYQWNILCASLSMTHQIWLFACNANGHQKIGNFDFWGHSGVWTPAGIPLIKSSSTKDELIVLKNIEIKKEIEKEHSDFYIYEILNNSIKN